MLNGKLGDRRLNRRSGSFSLNWLSVPTRVPAGAPKLASETLAAYRFFDNEKVTAEKVLEPHRDATLERIRQFPVVLCVKDTTELDLRESPRRKVWVP